MTEWLNLGRFGEWLDAYYPAWHWLPTVALAVVLAYAVGYTRGRRRGEDRSW